MPRSRRPACARTPRPVWRGAAWPGPTAWRRPRRASAPGWCRRGRCGEGAVGPGPGAEHPGRGVGQRGRRILGRRRASEPAGRRLRRRGSRRPGRASAVARATAAQRFLGRGERRRVASRPIRAASALLSASARAVNRASRPASSTRRAAGQGLLVVLAAGQFGEDRLGALAQRGRLRRRGRCRPTG